MKNTLTTGELIDAYLKEVGLTATPSTIYSYTQKLDCLSEFVQSRHVDRVEINKWLSYLIFQKLSPSTIKAYRSTVRSMYLWAVDAGLVDVNPVPRRFRLESPASEKIPIRAEDHAKILTQCHKEKHLFWYRACRIAWETGLRLSDIACLRRDQLNYELSYIDIVPMKTKRFGKRVQIPISNDLCRKMEEWSSIGGYILPEMKEWHDATGHRALSVMFGRIVKRAGLKGISFHSFRHGLVTRLLEKNVTVEIVSQITGQSYNQIMEYAHVDMETKRKALA